MQRTACRRPPTSNSRQATSIPGMHPRPSSFWPWSARGCRQGRYAATYHIPQPAVWSPISLPTRAETISVWGEGVFCVGWPTRPAPTGHTSPGPQQVGDGAQDQEPADQAGNRGSSDERPSAGRTTRPGTRSSAASTASGSAGRSASAAPHRTAHGSSCRQRRWAVGGDGPPALLRVDKGQDVGRTPPPGPRPGPHQRAFTLLPAGGVSSC